MAVTSLHHITSDDHDHTLDLFNLLTAPPPPKSKPGLPRRDSVLDPLLIAAIAASGPHVTRNHYHHDFFPRKARLAWKPLDIAPKPPLTVKCMARTRIPTPHGPAFLHLYHNNRDNKEHLAIVIDPAQLSDPSPSFAPPIRSHSLDAIWSTNETDMDRITRGAYVGRLTSTTRTASIPTPQAGVRPNDDLPSPLIRIHSECFTGETVGSMRCDCGEQLDEAMRLISQPIIIRSAASANPLTIPGRGAIIYLRQEGRGIGLLSKIRAYNLQDIGHDTVTANLMLGHQADERGYEIACAILRDLNLGSEFGGPVRVLTNNPDKVQALEKEGLRVIERVPMIPRSWQKKQSQLAQPHHNLAPPTDKVLGASLTGGDAVHGEDLDKYLRTKILRMGHILPLWMEE